MEVVSGPAPYRAPKSQFVPVVRGGKLAFKFDPTRGLIEWQHRGEKYIIDLAEYAANQSADDDQ